MQYFLALDQKIDFSIVCENTDTINKLEPEIYKKYPEFSKTKNFFLCKGTVMDKSKQFKEYKIITKT